MNDRGVSRRRLTLRQKVLAVLAGAAAVMLVVNIVSISLVRSSLSKQLDATLLADAVVVTSSVNASASSNAVIRDVAPMASLIGVVSVATPKDHHRSVVGFPDGTAALESIAHLKSGVSSAQNWRFYTLTTKDGVVVTVGHNTQTLLATNLAVTLEQLLATIASLLILLVMGAWMLSNGAKPLAQIAAVARRITDGQRGERVVVPRRMKGTEYADVADALNSMLSGLEELLTQEESLNEELRRFVSDAGHELRTPLTVLHGYGDLLRSGALDEAGQKDALSRIGSETARMSRLVEDLLALARLERQEGLRYEKFDLAEVVRDLASDHRAIDALGEHPLVEKAPGVVVVEADPDRISQVIVNILANFRAHTPAGTSATLSLSSKSGGVQIVYADDGPGVAEPERVLERFWQNDPGRRGSNSGLGMAISAAVIRAHGGQITAGRSKKGGMQFNIWIPNAPEA